MSWHDFIVLVCVGVPFGLLMWATWDDPNNLLNPDHWR